MKARNREKARTIDSSNVIDKLDLFCHEVFGCDARQHLQWRVRIRSLAELRTGPAVLIRDGYFEGGDVLRCYEGCFRFKMDGREAIEIREGDALVIYPDQRVTIEALDRKNLLLYTIFDGEDVAEYFDWVGFFDGLHGTTSEQRETFYFIQRQLEKNAGEVSPEMFSRMTDALVTYAHDFRENGNALLIDAIRQIRLNLKNRIVRLDPLYEQMKVSHTYLHRIFVQAGIGCPSDFIRRLQLRLVVHRLRFTVLPIRRIAEEAGFISLTHFANFIKRMTGQTAGEIRRGCKKMKLIAGKVVVC